MYSFIQTKRGFTLIELLVVIAIIGILASVVLAGLGSQRDRARESSTLSSVRSIVPVATVCHDSGSYLNAPNQNGQTAPTNTVCNNGTVAGDVWMSLPVGWYWGNAGGMQGDTSAEAGTGDFIIYATTRSDRATTSPSRAIVCNLNRCTTETY